MHRPVTDHGSRTGHESRECDSYQQNKLIYLYIVDGATITIQLVQIVQFLNKIVVPLFDNIFQIIRSVLDTDRYTHTQDNSPKAHSYTVSFVTSVSGVS